MISPIPVLFASWCAVAAAVASPPAIFSTDTYEVAKQNAADTSRIFLVDSTAVWCGPCKKMDKTTWIDESVMTWINEYAVAVQIDVDKQKALAGTLKIRAMPTIIAFRDDVELDRIVGYRGPDDLLEWLDDVRHGKKAIDKVRKKVADGGETDVDARYELAAALVNSGDHVEAAEEYVWLWNNMLKYKPSMVGVRGSFMLGSMKNLAKTSPEAKQIFEKLRTTTFKAMTTTVPDRNLFKDWVDLNGVVGDNKAAVVWYKKVKADPKYTKLLKAVQQDLFTTMTGTGEWAIAGGLLDDPERYAAQSLEQLKIYDTMADRMPKEQLEEMRSYLFQKVRQDLGHIYAACLAADREDAALDVADTALLKINDAEMFLALIRYAHDAGQPRKHQLPWLDEAEKLAGRKYHTLRTKMKRLTTDFGSHARPPRGEGGD